MATEGVSADDVLGRLQGFCPDVVTEAVEQEESQEQRDRAKADSDKIEAFFTNDSEVTWIIIGHKDGQSAAEIRELAEMTQTQYETARRRFRRGLENLFPGRRKS